ncbi:MAG TPA: hypothetical protein VFK05_26345 [Polyangiaceae bacterium]|nr:hypothetical protein [Polyangiaceae bacterium]
MGEPSVARAGEGREPQQAGEVASDPSASERSRELFRQGSALADDADWSAALKAYEASFALFPNATTLHDIGICRFQLGELSRAWYAMTRAIEGAEFPADRRLSPARRALVLEQRAAIRAQLASVRLTSAVPNLHVEVDGQQLASPGASPLGPFVAGIAGTAPVEAALANGAVLLLDPGTHQVELEVAGERQFQSLDLAPGESIALAWQQPAAGPSSSPAGPLRTYGTVAAWSVAGLGLVTAVVAGGIALGTKASLDEHCSGHICNSAASPDLDRYAAATRWANAGLIVGALGATAGVVLLATAPRGATANTAVLVSPTGLGLMRRF